MGKKPGRGGRFAIQKHDDAYWAKMRRDFERCQHEYSGAYCASAMPEMRRNFLVSNRRTLDG